MDFPSTTRLPVSSSTSTRSGSTSRSSRNLYRSGWRLTALAPRRSGSGSGGRTTPTRQDYLAFAPGHLVGFRAGWTATDCAANAPAVASLANQAAATTGVSARQAVYEKFQNAMDKYGPFIPLIQPAEVIVGTKNIKNLQANAVWLVNIRNLG